MSDIADFASEIVAQQLAVSLSKLDRRIPAGAPGECDDCGETMPRLIDGRCGFCRDGRRPPLSRFESLPTPAIKEPAMANPKPTEHFQTITVPAQGRALHAIRERADAADLPLGRAVLALIDDYLVTLDASEDDRDHTSVLGQHSITPVTTVDLSAVPTGWLTDELVRRLADAAPAIERDAAVARAVAAEGQLATIRQVLESEREQA